LLLLVIAAAGIRNLEMHLREYKSVGLWRAEVGGWWCVDAALQQDML
jgi:hypothetical protein